MTHHTWLSFALIAALLPLPVRRAAAPVGTLLLRSPTVSATNVAFVYAGDLWVAPRAQGGGGGGREPRGPRRPPPPSAARRFPPPSPGPRLRGSTSQRRSMSCSVR